MSVLLCLNLFCTETLSEINCRRLFHPEMQSECEGEMVLNVLILKALLDAPVKF